MKNILPLLLILLPAAAPAIELSLEENRAQRGNIGYVDMQRLFKLYPETIRARENFEEVVRQAEDQVNLKRAEVIRLRAEIAQLKIDREALAKAAPAIAAPAPAAPQVEISTPALSAPPAISSAAASSSTSTSAAVLPGLAITTGPVFSSMEGLPSLPPPAPAAAASLPLPLAAPAAAPPAPPSPLAELEEKLARRVKDLEQKEADFKDYQASAEKNLLDLESRRTEILLGKINKAVKAVAKREGISVIIDKGSILFGHDAVDLTEKVLKELKGA